MKMMWIRNGYMIDPASGREGYYDIGIENDRIVKIVESSQCKGESCGEIDATGLVVAPGLVDVHVHFREPGFTYKEDIQTGARAAAKGLELIGEDGNREIFTDFCFVLQDTIGALEMALVFSANEACRDEAS